ncbi:MAG: CoA-binding protein [Candidatus Thorarchaeota archaeon]
MTDLMKLFNPQAIGIIGVSEKPYGGGFFLKSLLDIGFEKKIFIFNPRLKNREIRGLKVYGSILELPEDQTIDYVIIAVPSEMCVKILDEVGRKKVPFVTVYTSGFSEIGRKDLEKNLLEIAKKHNVRILGPNCMGIFVPKNKISFSFRLANTYGELGIISQSGGLGIQLSTMAQYIYENPPNKTISIGNQVDLTFNDFLEYFYNDNEIKVIALYLENIKAKKDGQKFIKIVKALTLKQKPVIIWKVGSGTTSREAIMSHTGGLSGSQRIWESVSKQTGSLLVKSADELQNLAMTFHNLLDLPVNRKLGIITVGGGAAIQVTDILEQNGLILPEISEETKNKIRTFLPDVNTIIRNPLDLGSSGIDPNVFVKTILSLEQDPNISAIIFAWFLNFEESSINLIKEAYYQMTKPFICVSYKISDDVEYYSQKLNFKRELLKLKIPVYESIELMARSLDKYCMFKEFIAKNN